MPALKFPRSSTPGKLAGEGEGRRINAYLEQAGDTLYLRRCPGLSTFAETGGTGPRGLLDVNGTVYAAFNGSVRTALPGGPSTLLTGSVGSATDGVTWARNNRTTSGGPDVVAVRSSGGAFTVSQTTVAGPISTFPTANSVTFLDGYFLFTLPDGRIFASDLNSTTVNALSFATAESKPDGLVRGIAWSGRFYAFGSATIEAWQNAGLSPFPLQRLSSTIPVGLLAPMALAGHEDGWSGGRLFYVAHDGTVQGLSGFRSERVSTPDVERFIAASTSSTLEACVYDFRGHPIWALSSDAGTWEYDVSTGCWHERVSVGATRWRGSRSVKSNGVWVVGDTLSGALLKVDDAVRTEKGADLDPVFSSGPFKGYPNRTAVPYLFGEFTEATGGTASMRTSRDGGKTWSTPRTRTLADAEKFPVRWNALGLTTHHGLRVEFTVTGGIDFSFQGASVPDVEPRKP